MSLEIFIARHGQNEDNKNGILNGHRDLPLTELGRRQAYDLAGGIGELELQIDLVFSSPLQRAFTTAEIVCDVLGLQPPVVLPDLIERDFGCMTGKHLSEIEKLCAADVIKTDGITYFLNPKGAESFPDLVERGNRILKQLRSLPAEGNTLLVCHGDIGKMIYAAATRQHWKDVLRNFHFGNCDLIEIDSQNQTHKIQLPQHNL